MSVLAVLKTKTNDLFFSEGFEDNKSLPFLRISLSALLISLNLLLWEDFAKIYSSNGYIQRDISEVLVEKYIVTTYQISDFLQYLFGIDETTALFSIRWIYLIFLVFLGFGFLTRFSSIVCWLLHLSLLKSADCFMYGADYIHTILLFFCIIFPVGRYFSLDNKIFGIRQKVNALPYLRILQIQLCIIYFFAGIAKAMGENWWNGHSIWKSLIRTDLGGIDFYWIADYPILPITLGVGVICIETFYPIMIWVKKINKLWLWGIVAMHVSITFFLDLHIFSATMIIFNFSAFYFYIYAEKQKAFVAEKPKIKSVTNNVLFSNAKDT